MLRKKIEMMEIGIFLTVLLALLAQGCSKAKSRANLSSLSSQNTASTVAKNDGLTYGGSPNDIAGIPANSVYATFWVTPQNEFGGYLPTRVLRTGVNISDQPGLALSDLFSLQKDICSGNGEASDSNPNVNIRLYFKSDLYTVPMAEYQTTCPSQDTQTFPYADSQDPLVFTFGTLIFRNEATLSVPERQIQAAAPRDIDSRANFVNQILSGFCTDTEYNTDPNDSIVSIANFSVSDGYFSLSVDWTPCPSQTTPPPQ